jgi:hypothetical protein
MKHGQNTDLRKHVHIRVLSVFHPWLIFVSENDVKG